MSVTPFPSVNALLSRIGTIRPWRRIDWPSVYRAIGSVLPVDYRHLIQITGPIYVGKFLGVRAPGSTNLNVDLVVGVGETLGALQELKRNHGDFGCPYPLWFEPGGLLPWGSSDNGDDLFWLTRGHPDQWTVVVGEARGPTFEEHPLSACDFLSEFLSGGLESKILPESDGPGTVAQVDDATASG